MELKVTIPPMCCNGNGHKTRNLITMIPKPHTLDSFRFLQARPPQALVYKTHPLRQWMSCVPNMDPRNIFVYVYT